MEMSKDGRAWLQELEGLRLVAYQDGGGVWTIGYGDTLDVKPGDVITAAEADKRFARRVADFGALVLRALKRPVNQHEFDALTSLCYNVGGGAFGSSTLVKLFNASDVPAAARQFGRFIYRRAKEPIEVRRGDSGASVREWQKTLCEDGHAVVTDGNFGPGTESATKLWQAEHSQSADGVARYHPRVVDVGLVSRRFWEVVRFMTPTNGDS